jgi:hypothetical protein
MKSGFQKLPQKLQKSTTNEQPEKPPKKENWERYPESLSSKINLFNVLVICSYHLYLGPQTLCW